MRRLSGNGSPRNGEQPASKPKTTRVLNVPLLVGTLVVIAILAPVAYCWHSQQVKQTARALLYQAYNPLCEWVVAQLGGDDRPALSAAARKDLPASVVKEIDQLNGAEASALTTGAREAVTQWVMDLGLRGENRALRDAARQEVDWVTSATFLGRYLRVQPEDKQAQVRLAMAFDLGVRDPRDFGGKQRAIGLYYGALGLGDVVDDATRRELRCRLAELLLEMGAYASAEAEAEELRKANEKDPQAWRLLAMALYGQFQSGALVARPKDASPGPVSYVFEQAVKLNPTDVALAATLAQIYRDQDKEELLSAERRKLGAAERGQWADKVIDQLVAANPENPDAYLARYSYRAQYGLPRATDDLQVALKYGPNNLAVRLAAAGHARREAARAQRDGASAGQVAGYWAEARKHYEHIIKKIAKSSEVAYLGLGQIHWEEGAFHQAQGARYHAQGDSGQAQAELKKAQLSVDRAIEEWRRGVEMGNEESISLNTRLAEILISLGRLDEAWDPDPDTPEEQAKTAKTPLARLEAVVDKLAPRLMPAQRLAYERGIRLLKGRWFLGRRDYDSAIPLLKAVTAGQQSTPEEVARTYQAWLLLGAAHRASRQWDDAARCFEEAASLQPTVPGPRVQAAEDWRRAGQIDLAIRQYKMALAAADNPEVLFRLASAQFAEQVRVPTGRRDWGLFNASLNELKKPGVQDALREAWRVDVLEARYLLARAAQASSASGPEPKESPEAREAKGLLDEAEKAYPDSPGLFQALVLAYEGLGDHEDADRALARFRKLTPGSAAGYLLGSQVYCGRKEYDKARGLVRQGIQELPKERRAVLQAAVPGISLAEGKVGQAEEELVALYKANPSNIGFIWRLAELALRTKRIEDLKEWEAKLLQVEGPKGLRWQYCRAHRFLHEASQALARVKGATDRAVVERARTTAAAFVAQADTLSERVQNQWPDWARAYELRGRVLQQQAWLESTAKGRLLKYDQAVKAYQKAIKLGAPSIAVCEQLIPLLSQLQRFDEADRYLAALKSRGASSENLLQYEISAAARGGALPEAIALARRAVEARPRDPNAHIWHGRVLLLDGQKEAAEAAFKKAVQLDLTDAAPYMALFDFYLRTQQRERAEETVQELEENDRLSEFQLALTLAQAYERLGNVENVEKAEENYRKAESLAKDKSVKVAIKSRLFALLSRSDLSEAEKVLREILKLAPESDAARQTLANLLAQRAFASPGDQGEEEWQELEGLLQQSGSGGKVSSSSQRLQAALWVLRGGKDDLEAAEQLLKKLVEDGQADQDRFLLAGVYAAQSKPYRKDAERYQKLVAAGKRPQAGSDLDKASRHYNGLFEQSREQLLTLVAREKPNLLYLETYIDLLLRHREAPAQRFKDEARRWRQKLEEVLETSAIQPQPNSQLLGRYFALLRRCHLEDEADQWLTKLEKLLPDSLFVLGLRAVWLHDRKQTSDIEPLVEQLADKLLKALEKEEKQDVKEKAQLCLDVGKIYSAVEQHQAAERWYRRLAELVPERYEPLAVCLGRQGRLSEAIRTCMEAADSDNPVRPAMRVASLLLSGQPTEEDFRLAEPFLAKALKDHEDNAGLLYSLANLRVMQERIDDAVQLYRQVLERRPKDALVMNNLATLLAEKPETRKEALQSIKQAIRIAGPQAPLLDTKGTILILSGKPDQAIPLLEKATSAANPDPRYYLHLAIAYHQVGETKKAADAFGKARKGNVTGQILTKTDLEFLATLEQEFGQERP